MRVFNLVVVCLLMIVFPLMSFAQNRVSIKMGEAAPFDGIVITEQRAFKDVEEKIDLKEIERLYKIDKETWMFKEKQYLKGVDLQQKEIDRLKEKNDAWYRQPELWIVVGALATIGIAKGMDSLFKL